MGYAISDTEHSFSTRAQRKQFTPALFQHSSPPQQSVCFCIILTGNQGTGAAGRGTGFCSAIQASRIKCVVHF